MNREDFPTAKHWTRIIIIDAAAFSLSTQRQFASAPVSAAADAVASVTAAAAHLIQHPRK